MTISNIHSKFDIYEAYAQKVSSPVMLVDRVGINESTDEESISNALEHYEISLPVPIFNTLKSNEFFSVVFSDIEKAIDCAKSGFPEAYTNLSLPELKVIVHVFDEYGTLLYTNSAGL